MNSAKASGRDGAGLGVSAETAWPWRPGQLPCSLPPPGTVIPDDADLASGIGSGHPLVISLLTYQ